MLDFRHDVLIVRQSNALTSANEITSTEQQNDQNEYDRSYGHGLFDHRQKIAAARTASRTPIIGLETANQKEKSQPESCALRFFFMLFSQAFEHPHFANA
jgi:hypothetical protein